MAEIQDFVSGHCEMQPIISLQQTWSPTTSTLNDVSLASEMLALVVLPWCVNRPNPSFKTSTVPSVKSRVTTTRVLNLTHQHMTLKEGTTLSFSWWMSKRLCH